MKMSHVSSEPGNGRSSHQNTNEGIPHFVQSGPRVRICVGDLLKSKGLSIEDYTRSQDAKMGMFEIYNAAVLPSRPQSRISSRSSLGDSASNAAQGKRLTTPDSINSSMPDEEQDSSNADKRSLSQQKEEEMKRKKEAMKQKRERAAVPLQAACRYVLIRRCRAPGMHFDAQMILFFYKGIIERLASRCKTKIARTRYERDPYIGSDVKSFFPNIERSCLPANWECSKAAELVRQRDFYAAHKRLKIALLELQKINLLPELTEDELPTIKMARADAEQSRFKGHPFCSQPGCSRRPVKTCEWDLVSKVCDHHIFPAVWDRENKSMVFANKHPMNVALPCRRDGLWLNFLLGLHHRLGASKKCHVRSLLLEKGQQHGADKYSGNILHFIEDILNKAWTITVPDEYPTIEKAIEFCKDQTTVVVRKGYFCWSKPIEVRTRINVIGEEGTVLHGTWIMHEGSGGGKFKNVTCVASSGRCFHILGGNWIFEECCLKGFGDGCCVVACSGTSDVSMYRNSISGVQTVVDYAHPYVCVQCVGNSSLIADGCTLAKSSGYGLYVSDSSKATIFKSLLTGHFKSAVKIEKDAELEVKQCIIRDNTAFLESSGKNIPIQIKNYDATRSSACLFKDEVDCVKLVDNVIYGTLWSNSRRPHHILGKAASKNSIDKGRVMRDNIFYPGDDSPQKPSFGTGNEPLQCELPENSSLKLTKGDEAFEPYVLQRILLQDKISQPPRQLSVTKRVGAGEVLTINHKSARTGEVTFKFDSLR